MADRCLVLYVFHEYNDRVKYFIENAIFYDINIDFIIIANDTKYNNLRIKKAKNCSFYVRTNKGFDFGGWSEALLKDNLYKKYDKFIFVNSSVVGPFRKDVKWTDIYLNGLTDDVKLFGSTININKDDLKYTHVQSYIFSMDIETLKFLIRHKIFDINNYCNTLQDAIVMKEIKMSFIIMKNNWNIGSLLSIYKDIDFRNHEYINNITLTGDLMYPNHFRNKIWTLEELVFIKGNRFNL